MAKPTYSGAFASLRIMARTLDPLVVTQALLLPPDHTHRQGEPRLGRSKSGRVVQYDPYSAGMWSMSSERWVDSARLDIHIRWVLDQLAGREVALQQLLTEGAEADIFCYSTGTSPQAPGVAGELRERAVALGLTINIDHYESDSEDAV